MSLMKALRSVTANALTFPQAWTAGLPLQQMQRYDLAAVSVGGTPRAS
jgi:hypothetical protein